MDWFPGRVIRNQGISDQDFNLPQQASSLAELPICILPICYLLISHVHYSGKTASTSQLMNRAPLSAKDHFS